MHPTDHTRRHLLAAASGAALAGCASLPQLGPPQPTGPNAATLAAMKRATRFMRERCAYRGGYVWSYLPDFSRRWGEMEAYPTMIWNQSPGTSAVGHVYLDCYHATGDEYFYQSAVEVATCIAAAQHAEGGWNYLHDFAGDESTHRWYDTIGKNGWRLEEFQHYYGNCTYDDDVFSEAATFILRVYLEKRDNRFRAPLDRALHFVLTSQYGNGGWPQRYPFVQNGGLHGKPDYTPYVTFNDSVVEGNIKFLLMYYQTLGDDRALAAIRKSFDVYIAAQHAMPQPGWGLQHTVDTLAPIGARTYEPTALTSHTTAANIDQMMDFYQWTGEDRFLRRLPEAMDWLQSIKLPDNQVRTPGRPFPTFIELGTGRAIINHRRGSNINSGAYYQDFSPEHPIRHYGQWRAINLDGLRARYARLRAESAAELAANSPLRRRDDFRLPRFFSTRSVSVSDLNTNTVGGGDRPTAERVTALVSGLNAEGYWPTPLVSTSNPYVGDGPAAPTPGDYSETLVGDRYDTSPYTTSTPVTGISTGTFIQNMSALLQAVDRGG